ncbi:MAG: hypothetical protein EOO43_24090 [Flavobacterium sp.]|nr:MAG: hypothetical protein EOO43_24090 [Flavobacterium sp.]
MNDELFIDGLGIAHGLYLVLSCLQPDEIVEYDFSWIINGGWVKDEVPLIEVEKIIVLTEGKTDAEFISKSVQMLYPHLHAYYHFIDFDGFKVEGNASALVKMIKAFAASNVKHPIIAIFDNDTAGLSEMNNILRINLPNNIKVIKLPDIPLAKKYPTIGPTGVKVQNVNGLACGIEMYLGKEILLYDNAFTPIRWRDYKDSLGQYHGVLDRKDEVQNKFREMVKQNEKWDMAEMRILLNEMFDAFTN